MSTIIEVDPSRQVLRVRFTGLDRLLVKRGSLVTSLRTLAGARAVPAARPPLGGLGVRLPGASIPWIFTTGASWSPGRGWELWCVRRGGEVLELTFSAGRFRRVVLEVADPRATAAALTALRTDPVAPSPAAPSPVALGTQPGPNGYEPAAARAAARGDGPGSPDGVGS